MRAGPANRVVVVYDSPETQELVRLILEGELGVRVLTPGNCKEALELARKVKPALALVEVTPGDDGVDLVRHLKSDPATKHVRVVALTLWSEDKRAALDAGSDDWLPKPFEVDALVDKVRACLVNGKRRPGR